MAKGIKTGGRKKGTPNIGGAGELMQKCKARNVDPFEVMLDFITFPGDPAMRFQAAKEICQYIYPKRKALEVSGEISNPYLDKPLEELKALVKAKLKE